MNQQDIKILELEDKISKLSSRLDDVSGSFYKNNFSSYQDFNKECSFNVGIKVPVYTTLPICSVGQLAVSSGTLYVCSATNTWAVVGTQV